MLSIDTNILFPAVVRTNENHAKAVGFLDSLSRRNDVVISEMVLVELYCLLRNPAVLSVPVSAAQAVDVCMAFRCHPAWQTVGFPPESRPFHDAFWPKLRDETFARRRAYDWRIALSLLRHGVDEFATVNKKDFEDFGFRRVWNPLTD